MKKEFVLSVILLFVFYSGRMVAETHSKDEDITSRFTCPVFRQELKNQKIIVDTARIMRSEVAAVTRLMIRTYDFNHRLSSLAGLECFVNLRELLLKRGQFAKPDSILLDLSGNPNLEIVEIQNYYIGGKLDVSRNKQLRVLKCTNCFLKELDLTNNRNLEILDCSSNILSRLDLKRNTCLKEIVAEHQAKPILDGDPRDGALAQLILPDNRRSSNGVTKLVCGWNRLETLDLSRLPYLKELNFKWCKLKNLDVSVNTQLEIVNCEGNYIPVLDFAPLKSLCTVVCGRQGSTDSGIMVEGNDYRQLKSLILPKQIENPDMNYLRELDYTESELSKPIDFSEFPRLNILVCRSNELSSIDVSKNKELQQLDCTGNPISSLNLKENGELQHLNVRNTLLTELDLLHNTNMEVLMCDDDMDDRYQTNRFKKTLSFKIILSKEAFGKIDFKGSGRTGSVEYQGKVREFPGSAVRIVLK